jgi:hypothetical protein
MAEYRCYFVTTCDHISGILEFEVETDAEAIERSRGAVARHPGRTAELWQSSRLVRRNLLPSAPRYGVPVPLAAAG